MVHRGKAFSSLLAAVFVLGLGSSVRAQGDDTSIDVNTYWPAPGPGNYFAVRGAAIAPHLGVGFTLDLNYQHLPLTLVNVDDDSDVRDAVKYQVTADFLWSLGLFNWVQIGLALPTVLAMDGVGASPVTGGAELATTAIRDLRIDLKSRFIGRDRHGLVRYGWGLALAASLSVPTGDRDNFAGDRNVVGEPVLIADYTHRYFSVAVNVGARLRAASQFADVEVSHQLSYGLAGAGYLLNGRLQILAELYGLSGLTGTEMVEYQGEEREVRGNLTHLEIRGGLGYVPDRERDITIRLGAGAGLLTDTPGVPAFRILASLQYQPQNRDSDGDTVFDRDDGCDDQQEDVDEFDDEDGCPDPDNDEDGIPDERDRCTDEAEDVDQFEDEDGCPDPDNDGDGVLDADDQCPAEVEDRDEIEDDDGCPDGDNDADGVADETDRCPAEAEDVDQFQDEDGCPDPDNDADSVPDADDECPGEAEDVDQHQDEDGCPDLDNDGDGVADADDRCADQAETINGVTDTDGCQDAGAGVTVADGRFVVRGRTTFARGATAVPAALRAQLAQVALHLRTAALRDRAVVITAVGDAAGDTEAARTLARGRAEAVSAVLTESGIPASRIEVVVGDLAVRPTGLQVVLTLRAAE
jgi:outer membrane protein OmpA-like peptidoglycan-associated protein